MFTSNAKLINFLCVIYAQICFIVSLRANIFSIIQKQYQLDYSHIGTLILISGIAMQVATYLGGIFIKKWGYNIMLAISLAITGLSIFLILFVKSVLLFDLLFISFMFGFGACVIVLNMYTGILSGNFKGKNLLKLHLGASIGLCMGPSVLMWLISFGIHWQVAISFSSIPVFIFILPLLFKQKTNQNLNTNDTSVSIAPKKQYNPLIVWLFIIIFTCSQIYEHGVGTWFIIYAIKTKGITETGASKYLTLFLLSFPISRFVLGKYIDRINYHITIIASFILTFLLVLLGVFTQELLYISFTGIFICVMYPVIMSLMQNEFGEDSSDIIGFICMVGGILQYIFIWSIGKLGDLFSIQIGFLSLTIYMLIGALCTFIIKAHDSNQKC